MAVIFMKLSIIILFICFCLTLNSAAQELSHYKYIYKFQLERLCDTSKIQIDTFKNRRDLTTIINGEVKNSGQKAISFLSIVLKGSDTTITSTTNGKGFFKIKVKPSTYNLTISGIGYKTLHQSVSLNNKNAYNFKILIASESSADWYDIYSKQELTNHDIDIIKKCVKDNNGKVGNCVDINKYYIVIEI